MKMPKPLLIAFLSFMAQTAVAGTQPDYLPEGCPLVKMEVERLPELQVPRAGHAAFCTNGELVVIGGHTTGFVPTPTAEYYCEGTWHTIPMTYSHDQGFSLQLSSGKLMIGGGHEQPLGIGQTFSVDFYDPKTHSFSDFGCLDNKRCFADAVELADGKVVIVGNWYHKDSPELYDGGRVFLPMDSLTVARSCPFVFRTAEDDAIVFSRMDLHGNFYDSIIVERIRGGVVDIPLFRKWHPYQPRPSIFRSANSFIGDTCLEDYVYLFPVEDATGKLAIARLQGKEIALLPTAPTTLPRRSPWGDIFYTTHLLADLQRGSAFLLGHDQHRLYALCIDYGGATPECPAPVTLYHTDSLDFVPDCDSPVLTADGDIVLPGGMAPDHFTPTDAVLLLRMNSDADKAMPSQWNIPSWCWVALATALLATILCTAYLRRRRHLHTAASSDVSEIADQELMQRIDQLMAERQLFLQPDLKVQDIAAALGIPARRVSSVIRTCRDNTFVQYVNAYRVEYVKRLLQEQPSRKIASLWAEAGFSSETSFFRTFKALAGMTPTEWSQK